MPTIPFGLYRVAGMPAMIPCTQLYGVTTSPPAGFRLVGGGRTSSSSSSSSRSRLITLVSGIEGLPVIAPQLSFIGLRGFLKRVLLVVGYPYDKIQKHAET